MGYLVCGQISPDEDQIRQQVDALQFCARHNFKFSKYTPAKSTPGARARLHNKNKREIPRVLGFLREYTEPIRMISIYGQFTANQNDSTSNALNVPEGRGYTEYTRG